MKSYHIWVALSLTIVLGNASEPTLPEGVVDTQKAGDKPLAPEEALQKMTLPAGFRATLFAGEPDVMQPIAFDFDDRGRVWVVECFSYPDFKNQDRDRIIILADLDGDGRFDERKVFLDTGHRLSGIAVGFGGAWVCAAPELLYIPDADRDDVPDGKPVVHLNGFTLEAGHNMVNGLAWGPDGWLYGRHGITASSRVGRPGTPESERVTLNCGIWRYHPVRQVFEVVANGTTNPWGMDWDEHGQAFFSNNVIGHLWHLVPGAHYQRMFGEDVNPYVYELMGAISDHKHFAGSDWTKSRGGQGEHDVLGGGHSHAGAMIYQGDNWPEKFRRTVMMGNLHGNRLVYDQLERQGSGYLARHGQSFLMANDPWFRSITTAGGPDGGAFVSDWNDLGECHDSDGSYRSSGRLYKITYGEPKALDNFDLGLSKDAELVQFQWHRNEWFVRHSRRLLQERHAAGVLSRETQPALMKVLDSDAPVTGRLRALWALNAIGGLSQPKLQSLLQDAHEQVRWWAIQFLCENRKVSSAVQKQFASMARQESSALVRLALASALQRLPAADRWSIAEGLAEHAEDAADQNLPLMIWYGLEPLVPLDRDRATVLMTACKIPKIRQFIARRLAAQ